MLKTETKTYQRRLESFSYQSNIICNTFYSLEQHEIAGLFADIDCQQIRPLKSMNIEQTKPGPYPYVQLPNREEQTKRKKQLDSQCSHRERRSFNRNAQNKIRGTWDRFFNLPTKINTPYKQLKIDWEENQANYQRQFEKEIQAAFKISTERTKQETEEYEHASEQQQGERKEFSHELRTSKKQNPEVFNCQSNQLLIKFNAGSSRLLDAPKKSRKYRKIYNRELQQKEPAHESPLFNVKPYEVHNYSQHSSELVH